MTYAPIASDDWPHSLGHLKESFADNLNVYKVMAHHPDLVASWAPLRAHVVTKNALGPERQEIVILRVAARLNAPYEWAHHIDRAGRLGLDKARLSSIAGLPEDMSVEDALIARAVDDLLDGTRLDSERRRELEALVGVTGVFDLLATVGFYVTLGFVVNSFDVPLDEGIEPATIPYAQSDTDNTEES